MKEYFFLLHYLHSSVDKTGILKGYKITRHILEYGSNKICLEKEICSILQQEYMRPCSQESNIRSKGRNKE